MKINPYPLTMLEVIDLLISGREKLAAELVAELDRQSNSNNDKTNENSYSR